MAMCRGGNKAICAAAYGLRVASGSDCLDLYMMGDIEIGKIYFVSSRFNAVRWCNFHC